MRPNHDSVKAGVFDAWHFWLSQHDISVPETIHDAVQAAVKDWLNLNADELFQEAVAKAAGTAIAGTRRAIENGPPPPGLDWPSMWNELTGYITAAGQEPTANDAEKILEVMRDLRARRRKPIGDWMRRITEDRA